MLLVPTRVAPSSIHGLGLFAAEAIPLGRPVWRFTPGFDQVFGPDLTECLPPVARAHLRWFAYFRLSDGSAVLSGDHACFMNHAARPNTGAPAGLVEAVTTVALRDIAPGEELTCDYFAFDAAAAAKLDDAHAAGGAS